MLINGKRALAYIVTVDSISQIDGADNIELAHVGGWNVIVKKNEFLPNDKGVFFEIDSKLPEMEWSEFLRPKHFKVKTYKLSKFKVISQGLLLPMSILPKDKEYALHEDVTDILGVTYSEMEDNKRKAKRNPEEKYNRMARRHPKLAKKKWFRWFMKRQWGKQILFYFLGRKKDLPKEFPEWIKKTDEERIENCPWYLESTEPWIKTEKLDGTSCTYAVNRLKNNNFEFIVCSRNVRQADRNQECYHDSNIYWELADKYHIEDVLTKFAMSCGYNRVVLQGEGVGDVQKNPYKLQENDFYAFNLVIDGERTGTVELAEFCKDNGLKNVPILDTAYILPKTMEEFKLEADGFSAINQKVKREGFVYRTPDGKQSFKNVSREYLLKHNG